MEKALRYAAGMFGAYGHVKKDGCQTAVSLFPVKTLLISELWSQLTTRSIPGSPLQQGTAYQVLVPGIGHYRIVQQYRAEQVRRKTGQFFFFGHFFLPDHLARLISLGELPWSLVPFLLPLGTCLRLDIFVAQRVHSAAFPLFVGFQIFFVPTRAIAVSATEEDDEDRLTGVRTPENQPAV